MASRGEKTSRNFLNHFLFSNNHRSFFHYFNYYTMFIMLSDPPLPLTQTLPKPSVFLHSSVRFFFLFSFHILSSSCDIENQLYKRLPIWKRRKNMKKIVNTAKKTHLFYVVKYEVLNITSEARLYITTNTAIALREQTPPRRE